MKSKNCFESETHIFPLQQLLPSRDYKCTNDAKYRTVLASIQEECVVEPLMVYAQQGTPQTYLILDGHVRYQALKELGRTEAECILATEDEAFTYNARVSRLSVMQEHAMITKAVELGVSPTRIAAALNARPRKVASSLHLLDGINPDAARVLKDKPIGSNAIKVFKRVSAARQLEMAQLMQTAENYGCGYAAALVVGTPKDQMVEGAKPHVKKIVAETLGRMEQEIRRLEEEFKCVSANYGENMLRFTLARTYLRKLLDNANVSAYLRSAHADLLAELQAVLAAETI